jgi:hypothetical protein
MSDGLGSDLNSSQVESTAVQAPISAPNGDAEHVTNGGSTNGTASLSSSANGAVTTSTDTIQSTNNVTQASQAEENDAESTSDGQEPNKKKRKKEKPVNPNHKIGPWTDEEEQRFLESMDLYGRDWDKVLITITPS